MGDFHAVQRYQMPYEGETSSTSPGEMEVGNMPGGSDRRVSDTEITSKLR